MSGSKDGDYREEVQEGVKKYLDARQAGGERPKGPAAKNLVLEGMVEGLRIYRLYKQEEVLKQVEKQKRKHRRRTPGERHSHQSREPSKIHHRSIDEGDPRSREKIHSAEHKHEHNAQVERGDNSQEARDLENVYTSAQGGVGIPRESKGKKPAHAPNKEHKNAVASGSKLLIEDPPKFRLKKDLTLGVGSHIMNHHRRVQAEHDAGLRSKGLIEQYFHSRKKKDSKGKGRQKEHERDRSDRKYHDNAPQGREGRPRDQRKEKRHSQNSGIPPPLAPPTPRTSQSIRFPSISPSRSVDTYRTDASSSTRHSTSHNYKEASSLSSPRLAYEETAHSRSVEARERAQATAQHPGGDVPLIQVQDTENPGTTRTIDIQLSKLTTARPDSDVESITSSVGNTRRSRRGRSRTKSKFTQRSNLAQSNSDSDKAERSDTTARTRRRGRSARHEEKPVNEQNEGDSDRDKLGVSATQRTTTSLVSDWWSDRTETDSDEDGDGKDAKDGKDRRDSGKSERKD